MALGHPIILSQYPVIKYVYEVIRSVTFIYIYIIRISIIFISHLSYFICKCIYLFIGAYNLNTYTILFILTLRKCAFLIVGVGLHH